MSNEEQKKITMSLYRDVERQINSGAISISRGVEILNEASNLRIAQLEAEKAELIADKSELIMALILANEEIDDIDMHSNNFALILSHANK
jgi:hypothetical protein